MRRKNEDREKEKDESNEWNWLSGSHQRGALRPFPVSLGFGAELSVEWGSPTHFWSEDAASAGLRLASPPIWCGPGLSVLIECVQRVELLEEHSYHARNNKY